MWKWWYVYCILLRLYAEASNNLTAFDTPSNLQFLRSIRNMWPNIVGRTGAEDGRYIEIARKANKVQKIVSDNVPFPCNITNGRSEHVPHSVHKLRPGDIDVIAAMGDSLTAGTGVFADNLFQIPIENRGVSAAGGGQGTWRQYLTLPNIIKEFNPNLIGYALGDSYTIHDASQLNVAESGAMSRDLPYMAEVLIKRFKNNPRINLKNDWKFISLMIGANDFCLNICSNSSFSFLESHKTDIFQTLRILRNNLPRTFVALIPPPNVKNLIDTHADRFFNCFLSTHFECPCLLGLSYRRSRKVYYKLMTRWQNIELEIAKSSEFQKEDFVVVAQPVLMNITVPLTSNGSADFTYLAVDCFHISQKSNARYANSLWNNLLEPVGTKTNTWTNLFDRFLCPTSERPYLATSVNAKK